MITLSRLPRWLSALTVLAAFALAPVPACAFPPAPHHLIYGIVRDEWGNPLAAGSATLLMETSAGVQLTANVTSVTTAGGNYQLQVPMDSGLTADAYRPTAQQPTVPFKIRVKVGSKTYLPIEMAANFALLGQPGKTTLLNLTLGEDVDGDGLPDAWERALISQSGKKLGLADIKPGDDFDGDGLTNLQEYQAGTYAFDSKDGFSLKLTGVQGENAQLEFMAITGRAYTVLGSDDLQNWSRVSFQLGGVSPTTGLFQEYQAADVRLLRIVAKPAAGETPFRFFKLMVR